MFSAGFPSCSKGSLRQESLVLFLESSTCDVIQAISQLILCCFGPSWESKAEMHAPCSGNSSGRWCSGAKVQGALGPCSVRVSEQGRTPWCNPFPWCNESSPSMSIPFLAFRSCDSPGAEEVTFWASFCLSYLAGASQIQLIMSQHLRSELDTAKCPVHVASCEYPLISPGLSADWACLDLNPGGVQVLSNIQSWAWNTCTVKIWMIHFVFQIMLGFFAKMGGHFCEWDFSILI